MAAYQAGQRHGQVELQEPERARSEELQGHAKSWWVFSDFGAVVASCLKSTCTTLTRLYKGVCVKVKDLLGFFHRREQEEVPMSSENEENDGDKPETLAPACQQKRSTGVAGDGDTWPVRPEFLDLTTQQCGEPATTQTAGGELGSGTSSRRARLLAFVNVSQHLSSWRSAARFRSDEREVTSSPYSGALLRSLKGYTFPLVVLLSTLLRGRPPVFSEWLKLFDLERLSALCLQASPFTRNLLRLGAAATPWTPADWSAFVATLSKSTGVCELAAPAISALCFLRTFIRATLQTSTPRSSHVFALPPSPVTHKAVEKVRYEGSQGSPQPGQDFPRVVRFPSAGDSEEVLHASGEEEACASSSYVGVRSHGSRPMISGNEQNDEERGSAFAEVSSSEIGQDILPSVEALACGTREQFPNIPLENEIAEVSEQTPACWRSPVSSQGCLHLIPHKADNATTLKDRSTEEESSVESSGSAGRLFSSNGLLRPKHSSSRNAAVKPDTSCLESTTGIQQLVKAQQRSSREVCTSLERRGETRRPETICGRPSPRPEVVSPLSVRQSAFRAKPAENDSKIRKDLCGVVAKDQVVNYLILQPEPPRMSPDEALHPAPQGAKLTMKISDEIATIRRIVFGGFLCKAQSRTDVEQVICGCLADVRRN